MAQTNGQVPRASSTTDMAGLRQSDKDAPEGIKHAHPGVIKKNASYHDTRDLLEQSQMARIRTDTGTLKMSGSHDIREVQPSLQIKPLVVLKETMRPGREKRPLTAIEMSSAQLLCHVPVSSPPVHAVVLPSTTK
jgi:hypothetical protein